MTIFKLVALVTLNWDDYEEDLLELYFHSQENAELWIEDHRDDYHSFHYTIISNPPLALTIEDIYFED